MYAEDSSIANPFQVQVSMGIRIMYKRLRLIKTGSSKEPPKSVIYYAVQDVVVFSLRCNTVQLLVAIVVAIAMGYCLSNRNTIQSIQNNNGISFIFH